MGRSQTTDAEQFRKKSALGLRSNEVDIGMTKSGADSMVDNVHDLRPMSEGRKKLRGQGRCHRQIHIGGLASVGG